MQKINLEGLNEYVAYEKLDNNLDVYVYRKKDFHSFYAYYITNYGALNTEFVPINEEKMHKFPDDEQVKRIAAKGFIVENPDSCMIYMKKTTWRLF